MKSENERADVSPLHLLAMIQCFFAALILIYLHENPPAMWTILFLLIFIMSFIDFIAILSFWKKRSLFRDISISISITGIFAPVALMFLSVESTDSRIILLVSLFYAVFFPLFLEGPMILDTLREEKRGDWISIVISILVIYSVIAVSSFVVLNADPDVSFYRKNDVEVNNFEWMTNNTTRIRVSVINRGVSPAHNIRIIHENETVYTVKCLNGLTVKTIYFSMECEGKPFNCTRPRYVETENGTEEWVLENSTCYRFPEHILLHLKYDGEGDTISLSMKMPVCDIIYLSSVIIGTAAFRKRRRR